MKITIANKDFDFVVNGTVGIMFAAEQMIGGGNVNVSTGYGQLVMYYVALRMSNPQREDLPDFDTFVMTMTSKLYREMSEYFWSRWRELEPVVEETPQEYDEKNV